MIKNFLFLLLCLSGFYVLQAQNSKNAKYPSLLWEITGNGLSRPSYLFGTMHVSNKMVFHLSDSFYNAIRSTDAVALELNPDLWQDQMVRMDKLRENYQSFVEAGGNDYVTQNSFRLDDYYDELKLALRSEPAVVNSLLYRSYKSREDFEEDTFLDLYIFQTGRKLGKIAAGVENYYESEKLVLEAYADMAKERKKRVVDLDNESMNTIVEKVQNAYRRGDLDLMDSLDLMMERSDAFREKFLYKRNEIQANSIDSIVKQMPLFVGVGAAHLPGKRGVIELLREKGYHLRPVKMHDRDATQKSTVDNLRVPVLFQRRFADDNAFSVEVPGELYKLSQDQQNLNRKQYADMSNGSYYMITRVKTHAAFMGQDNSDVLRKVDSMLYENIPGKILSKTVISNNGYKGFDVLSRTRRGDKQRYQIFVTPFEVLIFKMSGKEDYIDGMEAHCYFSSIRLQKPADLTTLYQPAGGGFAVRMPHEPSVFYNDFTADGRWEYEALDTTNGNAYLILKKSVHNFNFIDEDSFDLGLVENSFRNPRNFERRLSRKEIFVDGRRAVDVSEKLKDSSVIRARYILDGSDYYVLSAKVNDGTNRVDSFFSSFSFQPYCYPVSRTYVDSFLRVSVVSPVVPELDDDMRKLVEQAAESAANGNNPSGFINYWPKPKRGVFRSEVTGEMISVKVQEYPLYYYIRDSAKFWRHEINELLEKNDMYLEGDIERFNTAGYTGLRMTARDTGSARRMQHMLLLKNNYLFRVSSLGDTLKAPSSFVNSFFHTFRPLPDSSARNLYESRLPLFFSHLFSSDSAVQNRAQQAIGNVYYGAQGFPMIMEALQRLNISDKRYFDSKTRLIGELGFITDADAEQMVKALTSLYHQTADTFLFQNEIVKSLTRLKTAEAYRSLKQLLVQDPPLFENNYEYTNLFNNLQDSLSLSATLFPDLFRLTSVEDYKQNVLELFADIVDSGYVKPKAYRSYLPGIFIDARLELKKLQSRDEKEMRESSRRGNDEEPLRVYSNRVQDQALQQYAKLLIPFYEKENKVKDFFSRLLKSSDTRVQLWSSLLLARNDQPVPDSIIQALAADDNHRATLVYELEKLGQISRVPAAYRTQEALTRSFLVEENRFNKMDSMVLLSKKACSVKAEQGLVYFYKYRVKKESQWKIGITGLQPLNEKEINTDDEFSILTDVRLREDEPLERQLDDQLNRTLFIFHKSARKFFEDER